MCNDTLKWTCFRSLFLRRKFELLLQILENIYKAVRILVFVGLNLNACVLLSYCVPYVTPWLILSFFLYHLTDFTRKWPSRGKTDVIFGKNEKIGGLNLNACVLLSYCVPYVTPWLILSFFLYHLTDFTRKWPSRGKTDVIFGKNEKIGGRSATSPHHTRLL